MDRRFDTLLFPGGKSRAFTLSYDDAVVQDRRLAELFRSYGAKATFNINAGMLGREEMGTFPGKPPVDFSKVSAEEIATVYAGHEIGGHGLYHSDLPWVGTPRACYEILEDKRRLEALCGQPLRMFAYPYGTVSDDVKEALRLAGYHGARTVCSTHSFALPEDPLLWDPTCHHNDPRLMELARDFLDGPVPMPRPLLFYVWGHGYEFDGCDNWGVMEELLALLTRRADEIWFATNGEILAYLDAYRRLEYSADASLIRNPSALDVMIAPQPGREVLLKAGAVTRVPDPA